jgi:hypothetical protein
MGSSAVLSSMLMPSTLRSGNTMPLPDDFHRAFAYVECSPPVLGATGAPRLPAAPGIDG